MTKIHPPEEQSRPTPTVEDYLMTMYVMDRDYGEIVAARLAEMLNVSPATVAMTFRRMERDNWLTGRGRKGVHLTPTGLEAAYSVIRRHMLVEWLLVSVLKVPLYRTHDEAHNIEHAISPELEARLAESLGNPKVCPHGNPFPGFEHVTRDWTPLADVSAGGTATIRRIHEFAEDNPELLTFMIQHGIVPGKEVRVVEVLPFNHTLTVDTGGEQVTLGSAAARFIFVEHKPAA